MSKIETIKLDNGLTIYLLQDLRRHSSYFQLTTKCGGMTKNFKLDGKEYHLQDGVAHILEHYIVECNEEGNFIEDLGKKQMNTNASTSMIITSYYVEAVENIGEGIKKILKGIYNVNFTKEKLEKLKNPIYQEIRENLDNKFYHLNRMRFTNLFNHFDFRDTGGLLEEVKVTTINDLKALYDAFYQPNNQIITIAGNFDKEEILDLIKNFYKNKKIKKHNVELITYKEEKEVNIKEDSFIFETPQDYVELSIKIDMNNMDPSKLIDYDFYLKSFLYSSFCSTSPLYQELVKDKIIVEPLSSSINLWNGYYIVTIGGYTSNRELLKERLLKEIRERNNLSKEKFELDKKHAIIKLILRDESIYKMIGPFLHNVILFNYNHIDSIEDIEKLTYNEYQKTIKNIDMSNYIFISIIKK